MFGITEAVPIGGLISWVLGLLWGVMAVFQFLQVLMKGKLEHWLPVLTILLHDIVCMKLASTASYKQSPERTLLLFIICGMDGCQLMTKIRFVASTNSPWPIVHLELLPFLAISALQIAGFPVHEGCLAGLLLWQVVILIWVWQNTISRICKAFRIPFLAPVPEKVQ